MIPREREHKANKKSRNIRIARPSVIDFHIVNSRESENPEVGAVALAPRLRGGNELRRYTAATASISMRKSGKASALIATSVLAGIFGPKNSARMRAYSGR